MSKKLGTLVKNARTAKGLTQSGLADMVDGLSASMVGKIERGEAEPEEAVLRAMAKPLGVTQVSLVDAASAKTKAAASSKTAASKTKTTSASKAKASSASKTKTASSAKKASSSSADLKLSAAELKLVKAYRKADSDTKKTALKILEGTAGALDLAAALLSAKLAPEKEEPKKSEDLLSALLSGKTGSSGSSSSKDPISQLIEGAFSSLGKRSMPEDGDETL